MATQDVDASSTPAPLPEAISAALARVREPKGRKALAQAFAVLFAERDPNEYRRREWMLYGALRYAWQLGQLSDKDYALLTDFHQWEPPA